MAVIHPGIFQVLKRFPEQKEEIFKCFSDSDSFRSLCEDYKQCSEALQFWSRVGSAESLLRKSEYEELLQSLELEILLYVQGGSKIREKD
ncbi:MAG: hypothetical protein ACWGOX_14580 [Desulforhopalus sp.]